MSDAENHTLKTKEYELCHDQVKHLDNNIWAAAGLIGLGSIGSVFFGNSSRLGVLELSAIASLLIAIVWIWWAMASRWWDIQHSAILRIKHIEKELHMFRNRYVSFLDHPIKDRRELVPEMAPLHKGEIDDLLEAFPNFYRGQVKGSIVWLPRIITVIWIAYPLVRFALERKDVLMQVIGTITVTNTTLLLFGIILLFGGFGIGLAVGVLLRKNQK